VKLGDVVRIRRIWINQPPSYTLGMIVGMRGTHWDEDYRILTILTSDGTLTTEPLNVSRDAKNVDYIIC